MTKDSRGHQEIIATFQWLYLYKFKFSQLDPCVINFIGLVPCFYDFIWKVFITCVPSLMFGATGS